MSGIILQSEEIDLDSILEQIKASQNEVFKAFEKHSIFVTSCLELIKQKKIETKVKFIKIKDPLEEIKKIKETIDTKQKDEILTQIVDLLYQYQTTKISASFKEIFINILNTVIDGYVSHAPLKELKEKILSVRDIRWLLIEMEKHPQYFQFSEEDLELMKNNGSSRDNLYLIKKFLKKDGDYEEFYPDDECCKLKYKYHMTGGFLDGEYTEFYKNGNVKLKTSYKNGLKDGLEQVYKDNNSDPMIKCNYKYGKLYGEYLEWDYYGILRKKIMYNNSVIEMDDSYFTLSDKNFLHCLIKDLLIVFFYSGKEEPFVEQFKKLHNDASYVVYGTCDISQYTNVEKLNKKCNKPFEKLPSLYVYNKGSPIIRYTGELDSSLLLEFIKEFYSRDRMIQ